MEMSEASRRMFALRESGYDGPIDQDGNPVSEESFLAQYRAKREEIQQRWRESGSAR